MASPVKQRIERSLSQVCCNFSNDCYFRRAIAMRNFYRQHFMRGVVSNEIFHCGLMLIGIVILQAWPNEGISHSGTYNHKIWFCGSVLYSNFGRRISPDLFGVISAYHLYSFAHSETWLSMKTFFTKPLILQMSKLFGKKGSENTSLTRISNFCTTENRLNIYQGVAYRKEIDKSFTKYC